MGKVLRIIGGVLVGFFVINLLVVAGFSVIWFGLGQDFTHYPGTADARPLFSILTIILGFAGAIIGGFLTAVIGKSPKQTAMIILAALVLVLGMTYAGMNLVKEVEPLPDGAEISDVPMAEWEKYAKEPNWVAFINPLFGAAGVLLGGRLGKRRLDKAGAA